MNSIFIMFEHCWMIWTPKAHPSPAFKNIYKGKKRMRQCNSISHFSIEETFSVTAVHCGEIGRDRRREEARERIKWKELVRWSRRHLWSAVKLNPLIPHPLLFSLIPLFFKVLGGYCCRILSAVKCPQAQSYFRCFTGGPKVIEKA